MYKGYDPSQASRLVRGRSLNVIEGHLREIEKSIRAFVELPICSCLCLGSTLLVIYEGLAHRLGEQ